MNPNNKRIVLTDTGIQALISPIGNSEDDLFPGTRPIYPASAKGFDPLKAQFRRAEIYKLALQRAVDFYNYEGHVNLSLRNIPYHEMDIDYMINDAKMEIDNGK